MYLFILSILFILQYLFFIKRIKYTQLHKLIGRVAIILFCFFQMDEAIAQRSITTVNTAVTESFTIGTTASATLPTGFRAGGSDWFGSATATTLRYGISGAESVNAASAGGCINWANGAAATATDRSIGFLATGSYSAPRSILFAFTNNTGVTVTSILLSYNYEKYRQGTSAFDWKFYHGQFFAGTEVVNGGQSYPANANNNALATVEIVSKYFIISNLSITNGTTYYLRWEYSGSSSNAQGLGLDDFSITLNPATKTTDYFRSNSNNTTTGGSWATASNWQSSSDNINWLTATLAPTSAANTVTIRSGHNININSGAQTVDQLIVDANATLVHSGGTFAINNGTGTDVIINGTFTRSTTSTFSLNGTMSFGAGATYNHQLNGGTIPSASWNATSICNVSGITNTNPNGSNQVFGRFIWNCASQSTSVIIGEDGSFNPKGLFSVQSTGSGNIRLENAGNGSTYNIDGGLEVSGGTLVVNYDNNGGSKEAIINVTGNLSITGNGILNLADGSANGSGSGYMATLNLKGDLYINNTTTAYPLLSTATENKGRINFTGTTIQNYYRTSSTGSSGIDYEIPATKTVVLQNPLLLRSVSAKNFDKITVSGTLQMGTHFIDESAGANASFIVNAGGTIQTANTGGLVSAIAVGGTKTFTAGANYTFNGNTITPFPTTTFGNPATININANVTSNLAATLVITTALNINTGGTFTLNGTNNVQLNTGVTLTIASGATFDNGGNSQILVGSGTPSIVINGTFITRDPEGFTGTGAAIPTITPTLGTSSSIQYTLLGNQNVQNAPYANVLFGGSGIKTITTNIASISGNVTINGSAIVNAGTNVLGGSTTGLIMDGTSRLIVSGNRTVPDMAGTYTLTNGTIEFNGNNAAHLIRTGVAYRNIIVSGANVQVASGNLSFQGGGSFIVDATAKLSVTTQQIIANAATVNVIINGTFATADADGFYGVNASIPGTNANVSLGSNSTIEYNRTDVQAISAYNYANLTISGARSNRTVNFPNGTVGIAAVFSLTATNAIYATSNNTIHFNGTIAQSVPVFPYNILSVSNNSVKTLTGDITCGGGLQINANSVFDAQQFTVTVAANTTITIAGTFRTANTNGFSGANNTAIRTNVNTVFALTNGTIEYNAGVAQKVTARTDYANLTISNAGTKTLQGDAIVNGSLNLNGGVFDISDRSLVFQNGNTPIVRTNGTLTTNGETSLIFGTSSFKGGNAFVLPNQLFTSATPTLKSFIVNRTNSLTLNNQSIQLTKRFELASGELILPSNYLFTLKSTSITNTALVAPVGGTITYGSGAAFVVERFFPRNQNKHNGNGVRAFRDITTSVLPDTDIFNSWQEAGVNNNGFGTQITGKVGVPGVIDAVSGLDLTVSGNASLYGYDVSTITGASAWTNGFAATKNVFLSPFKGYRITIRGNRENDLSIDKPYMNANVVLRNRGKLVTGTVVYTKDSVKANGVKYTNIRLASNNNTAFTMIGNPYACPLDFEKIKNNPANAGIQFSCWIFDPNIGTTGAYVTYNAMASTNSNNNSAVNRYIQPGQAFFIRNNGTLNPYLEIREEDKAVDDPNNLVDVFSEEKNAPAQNIRVNLLKPINNVATNMDGAVLCFKSFFSKERGGEDALKFSNSTENIAWFNGGSNFSIDGRPLPTGLDSVTLRVWTVTANSTYQLSLDCSAMAFVKGFQVLLRDRFTRTTTTLKVGEINLYAFTTTADTNSFNNRFTLIFSTPTTLPVQFKSVKAFNNGSSNQVSWQVAEQDMASYDVEFTTVLSTPFTKLTSVASNQSGNYTYEHKQVLPMVYYYRIKALEKSGEISYSSIVKVDNQIGNLINSSINVYPNPVVNKTVNIEMSGVKVGKYIAQIFDSKGSLVFEKRIEHGIASNVNISLLLPSNIAAGKYELKVVGNEHVYSKAIVVN